MLNIVVVALGIRVLRLLYAPGPTDAKRDRRQKPV